MCDKQDIGKILYDLETIGPHELAKLHKAKQNVRDAIIYADVMNKRPDDDPMPSFVSQDKLDEHANDAKVVFF